MCNRPFLSAEDQRVLEEDFKGIWAEPDLRKYRLSDESLAMMDRELIRQVRRFASPKNRLYIIGDFCMGGPEKARHYREKLGGYKEVHLVWGNHDNPKIESLFDSTAERMYITSDRGQKMVLDHYAPLVWKDMHQGRICLHGHSHGNLDEWVRKYMPARQAADVGVDVAYRIWGEYRPFTSIEAIEYIEKSKRPNPRSKWL